MTEPCSNPRNTTFDFSHLAECWPSAIVAREKIGKFTGGLLSPKYIANLDSLGLGPENRFRVGRKVAYPVQDVIEWLRARAEVVR